VKLSGKRGSYTVFLVMFMSGMLVMAGAVINHAHVRAIDSSAEDLGRVWALSILGEYDRVLRDRYGLMGYYGNEYTVEDKLARYARYTYKSKKYIKVGGINADLERHKLSDLNNFRDQINLAIAGLAFPTPFEEDDTGQEGEADPVNRKITAKWIINGLPSRRHKGDAFKGFLCGSFQETIYIFQFFKDHVDQRDLGKTYFTNEIEYIITGKLDDEKARKAVYYELLTERNALNLAYLYTCETKRQATLEAAELLTPGPEAVITQALIMEAWAFLEARNDVAILYDGKGVPMLKEDDNWALSLDAAINEVSEDDRELDTEEKKKYVKPKSIEGEVYEDYLKTLLLAVPEKKKLLRIMDLIQINMKYAYCGHFLMDDHYQGVDYEIKVNGKDHEFSLKYGWK